MKPKILTVFLMILGTNWLLGQIRSSGPNDFSYTNWQIKKVTFYEPISNPSKWVKIFEDPSPSSGSNIITSPSQLSGQSSTTVWEIGKPSKPVCYISGCFGRVNLEFSGNCLAPNIYVKGIGPDGFETNWTLAIIDNSGNYTIPPTNFINQFAQDEVLGYEKFRIDWYIKDDLGANSHILIGSSEHPLYVTHKISQNLPFSNGNPVIYHSYLFISCIAAHGESNSVHIFNSIYDDFEDQKVFKFNSTNPMEYWGTGSNIPPQSDPNTCFTGAALIAYNNATCGAWADLLVQLSFTHGIPTSSVVLVQWEYSEKLEPTHIPDLKDNIDVFFGAEKVNVYWHPNNLPWTGSGVNPNDPNAMFFVKDWSYSNLTEFYGEYETPGTTVTTLNNGNIIYGADKIGISGQGNNDPRPDFENHAIVSFNSKLYDPSYGTDNTLIQTEADYENESIYGYGVKLYFWKLVNGNPEMFDIIYPVENNTSSPQLKFTY